MQVLTAGTSHCLITYLWSITSSSCSDFISLGKAAINSSPTPDVSVPSDDLSLFIIFLVLFGDTLDGSVISNWPWGPFMTSTTYIEIWYILLNAHVCFPPPLLLDGCQSIARIPPSISSGFPENLPVPIYFPEWWEALWELLVLPKNTTHWPSHRSRARTSRPSPPHQP